MSWVPTAVAAGSLENPPRLHQAKGPARPSKGKKIKEFEKWFASSTAALTCPSNRGHRSARVVQTRGPRCLPVQFDRSSSNHLAHDAHGDWKQTSDEGAAREQQGPCSVTDFGSRCREGGKRREHSLSENPGVWSVLSKTCIRAPIHRHPGTASKRLARSGRGGHGSMAWQHGMAHTEEREVVDEEVSGKLEPRR